MSVNGFDSNGIALQYSFFAIPINNVNLFFQSEFFRFSVNSDAHINICPFLPVLHFLIRKQTPNDDWVSIDFCRI